MGFLLYVRGGDIVCPMIYPNRTFEHILNIYGSSHHDVNIIFLIRIFEDILSIFA